MKWRPVEAPPSLNERFRVHLAVHPEVTLRKALQNTGLADFRQYLFVDSPYTHGYCLGFLTARFGVPLMGGVAQLGERLNGIQEVRGSIPLASITGQSGPPGCPRNEKSARPAAAVSAGIAQLVEHNLAKVGVAGSSPVSRSFPRTR